MDAWLFWFIMVAVVLLPPMIYLRSIRRAERYRMEPWGALLRTFGAGAVVAVIISLILSLILFLMYKEILRVYEIFEDTYTLETLFMACIVAPVVEEAAKGMVVWKRRRKFLEEEDGLVYGASAGLGFSATENMFYGLAAYLVAGTEGFVVIIIVRSISAVFLHASATALTGYGISQSQIHATSVIPYYIGAVLLHSAYNFLASLSIVMGEEYGVVSLLMVIALGWLSFRYTKQKIRTLDSGGKRRA